MQMMRGLAIGGGVAAWFVACVAIARMMRPPLPRVERFDPFGPHYTVMWRNPDVELVTHACRGTITELDENFILISDDVNMPVIVDRRLITSVTP